MRLITTNTTPTPTLRGIADHSWQERGMCAGLEPDEADALFHPMPRDHEEKAEAKAICARCPVRQECFDYAIDHDITAGIWGGMTGAERSPWLKKRDQRLDYSRVRAVFTGRDVHLTKREKDAAIRHAAARGWSPERIAYTLQLDLDWARDQMRAAAKDIADRDRYWDLYEQAQAGQQAGRKKNGAKKQKKAASTPVPGHVHTAELVAELGEAA